MPFSPGTSGNPSGRPKVAKIRLDGRINGNARDSRGRFQIGNHYGKGSPCRQTEAGYLEILMEECPPDVWRQIAKKAIAAASEGDDKSRAWLANYLVGSPTSKAPSPASVVLSQMLGTDEILDTAAHKLAAPIASDEMFPVFAADTERLRQLESEARQFLISREAEEEPCPEP